MYLIISFFRIFRRNVYLCQQKQKLVPCLYLEKKDPDIFHLICQTYHELSDIAPEDFSDVYAEAVENAIDKYSRIRRHDFLSQPKELTQLVYSLVKEKGCKSVFYPFSGISYYE